MYIGDTRPPGVNNIWPIDLNMCHYPVTMSETSDQAKKIQAKEIINAT